MSSAANVEKVREATGSSNSAEAAVKPSERKKWVWSVVLVVIRVLAFCATMSATIIMALNKQTKTLVVATVGTTPITATISAKFHHTPAFVFFVIANGIVSLHNLLMLAAELFGRRLDYKGFRLPIIAILDMMNVAVISGGANGAAFMAELGKNGNSHARWDKICDKFQTFCDHGGAALAASFVGLLLMLIISTISILKFSNILKSNNSLLL